MKSYTTFLGTILCCLLFCATASADTTGSGWYQTQLPFETPGEMNFPTNEPMALSSPLAEQSAAAPEQSSAIQELAASLQTNIALIAEYVYREIEYAPYYGSLKGAEMTLMDRCGNDLDQASLLIALLKASGYSCQYLYGTMTLPKEYAANWVGMDDNPDQTGGLFACGGIPVATNATQVSLNRIWVYASKNGIGYQIDPAYKQHSVNEGVDLLEATGYDRAALLNAAGGETNAYSIRSLNRTNLWSELSHYSSNLLTVIKRDYPNAEPQQITGGRTIIALDSTHAQAAVKYPTGSFSAIPTNLRHQITFTLGGYSNYPSAGIVATRYLDEVSGKKTIVGFDVQLEGYQEPIYQTITSSIYHPETWRYNSLAKEWQISSMGYYEYNSRRVLVGYVNHQWVESKVLLDIGDEHIESAIKTNMFGQKLIVGIQHVNSNLNQQVEFYLMPSKGMQYAVASDFGQSGNGSLVKARQKKLEEYRRQNDTNNVLSETLNIMGLVWMQETSLAQEMLQRYAGVRSIAHHRLGVVAQEEAYYLDIRAQMFSLIPSRSGGTNEQSVFLAGTLLSSAMEHSVLEQLQGTNAPAVSTVKALGVANQNYERIYRVDSNNYAAVTNLLSGYAGAELNSFASQIAAGRTLVLPETRDIALGDWLGTAYLSVGAFEMAPMIGGQYGGYSAYKQQVKADEILKKNSVETSARAESSHLFSPNYVDMSTGNYALEQADSSIGNGLSGMGLNRSYSSGDSETIRKLGRGWTHTYDLDVRQHSQFSAGLGQRTATDMVPWLTALTVSLDLLEHERSAKGWLTAALVNEWAAEQLTDNAVSVRFGDEMITFLKQPDGTFMPPPGLNVAITFTNGLYSMTERHGKTYNFGTNGNVSCITDPDGNRMDFYYNAQTNLYAVSNSFGKGFRFDYNPSGLVTSVVDSAGGRIGYEYTGSNLTACVDAESNRWEYTYDNANRLQTVKDPLQQILVQNSYNSSGQVTNQISPTGGLWKYFFSGVRNVQENPLGAQTQFYFDDRQQMIGAVNALGQQQMNFYDGQGHVVTNEDSRGIVRTFTYDGDNNLKAVTEASGTPEERVSYYCYDTNNHLICASNQVSSSEFQTSRFEYDSENHPTKIIDALGNETTFEYFPNGLLKKQTEAGVRTTEYTYDAYGNPDTVVSLGAGTVDFDYNTRGDLVKQTDAKTAQTEYSYNKNRKLVRTLYADGSTVSNIYYKNGLLQKTVDAKGGVVSNTWNSAYKLQTARYPDGSTVSNTYDAADRLIAVKDARDNTATNTLDAIGRITVSKSPAGTEQRFFYDKAGNVTNTITDPAGRNLWTRSSYDALNRPLNRQSSIATQQFQYDALGRQTNTIDALSKSWKTTYDLLGRKTAAIRPSGATEQFVYDALGNRIGFYNAEGKPITFGFDAQGRVTAITNAIGKVISFAYDVNGNLTDRTNAKNEITHYDYNALNRLTNVVHEGQWKASFAYDANGNLLNQQSPIANQQFSYDSMSRLRVSTQSVYSVSSVVQNSYDLNGNRTNIVYPGGLNVGYSYDAENRLVGVTTKYTNSTKTFAFGYDGASRLASISYPNGVNSAFGYDAESRVTNYVHGTFLNHTITRDPRGFKTREDISQGLVPAITNSLRQTRTHNDADQLTAVENLQSPIGNQQFFYDPNGCLTSSVSSACSAGYSYDYASRLLQVSNSQSQVTYLYDASGARIGRIANGVTNYFVLDYNAPIKMPLAETDSAGSITRYYIWSSHGLLAHLDMNPTNGAVVATRYYHADEQGSTLALTDESGTVTDQFAYSPYGQALGRAGSTDTPYQWLGGLSVRNEGNGLYYMLNRYYSVEQHRFISPDPSGIDGGANLYAYGNLNPLFYTDPFGLSADGDPWYQRAWDWFVDDFLNEPETQALMAYPAVGVVAETPKIFSTLIKGISGLKFWGRAADEGLLAAKNVDEFLTLYRGEQAGTSVMKSYAAREGGYAYSQNIIRNSSLDDLMRSHAFDSANPASPFISTTADPGVARFFAGPNGVVHELQVPANRAIQNLFNDMMVPAGPGGRLVPESEFLIPNYIRPSEIIR